MTKPNHRTLLRASHAGRRFCIKFGGEGIGYYLYVYDEEGCTQDYLQDTLDLARACALEMFGVPAESWTEADERA